jgi:tape measure domain-containing protein
MSQTTELLLKIRQQGGEQLTRLQSSLKNLGQQSNATNVNFKELANELKNVQQTSVQSINNLRGYATAWREIANSVKIGSAEFKQATAEAAKLEAQLRKTQGGRGRLAAGAQIAGTVAGAGVFGGIEGALGAGIGGLIGGVPGAIVGGGIGAQVGMTRQALGGTATYAADIARQRQALQLVTKDAGEYARALRFIDRTSRELAIPQELITRQFTQLTASVKGAGGNVRDAETAFLGIASGIRGTGGSLEQLDSALLATSQVFSKGKVSAEELRQQIGERLPGAFSLFAESIGMTPQELDKALEKGQVSLQDFQKFAEQLFKQYGENAKVIADGPDAAGDRLRTSLSRLSESIGTLLKPIGAAFQNEMAKVVLAIDAAIKKLNQFFGLGKGRQGEINQLQRTLDATDKRLRAFDELFAKRGGRMGLEESTYRTLQQRKAATFAQLSGLLAAEVVATPAGPEPPSRLPGITADSKEKKAKKQKELVDRTKAELDLIKQINAFEREGLTIQAAYADFQLRELEVSLGLERNVIGRNKAIEISQENLTRLYKVADQAFRGFGTEIIKQFDEQAKAQSEITKTIQDAEIAAGILTEEKAKQLLIDRQIAEFTAKYPQATAEQVERLRTALSTTKEGLTDVQELGKSIIETFATGLGDAFMNLFERAKSFRDILGDILKQTARLLLNFGIQAGLKGLFPNLFASAYGNVMTAKGPLPLKKYARGGITSGPVLSLAGEAGPEAIVPLPDGRAIPVKMMGKGGSTNVTVNVDASGTSAQGNQGNARQLGVVVAAAVQAELVKQKRPGGLLA